VHPTVRPASVYFKPNIFSSSYSILVARVESIVHVRFPAATDHRSGHFFGSQGRRCCCRLSRVLRVLISVSGFHFPIECGSLQGEVGIVLESPDQKTREYVQIALPRGFSESVHQVFSEMPVRI
jgi:hypothetical protein